MPLSSNDSAAVCRRARELLTGGDFASPLVRTAGQVGEAVPVLHPDGGLHSWFVPITVDGRIAGFFQLLPDHTLLRYSTFQRHEDTLDGCPPAASWLDREAILSRLHEKKRPDETVGPLFLSYDRTPERLAWAVVLTTARGATRTLYVSGRAVWEATDRTDDSFGGPGH